MRFPGSLSYLLRNIGLELLAFVLIRLCFGLSPEPAKLVVKKSFWIASSRCWIHLLPLTVSLVLIWLNLKGFYIAQTFSQYSIGDLTDQSNSVTLALIQIAAKVQELLIIASFSTVVFQAIRDALLHDGIPLGLATSGLSFARLSYFWSPAFWGGTSSIVFSGRWKAMWLVSFIASGGLIAITAGPASAVLMLPRPTKWHYFTTEIWLNGTADVFWPTALTSDHVGGARCRGIRGLNSIDCVAKGLAYIESYYAYFRAQNGYEIFTPESQFPRILQAIPRQNDLSAEAWSYAPHAATSLVKSDLWYDPHWYPTHLRPKGIPTAETSSQGSAVRTVCTREILSFSEETYNISLPAIPPYDQWAQGDGQPGPYMEIELAKPLWGKNKQSLTNLTGLTTVWVPTNMSSVTAGLVVLGPLTSDSATQRLGVVCSIDARWNRARHIMTPSQSKTLGNSGPFVSVVLSARDVDQHNKTSALPIDNGDWRHIAAEPEWLEALTPIVPVWMNEAKTAVNQSIMTTALANLYVAADIGLQSPNFTNAVNQTWVRHIESITSTAMADAVSRVGLAQQYDTLRYYTSFGRECSGFKYAGPRQFCPGPPPYNQFSLLSFRAFLTGYAYKASKTTDYLSICVLLFHIIVALTHTLQLVLTRYSSDSWDSAEELIVLAQVSRTDTKDLKHTSAGIKRFSTMALNTRVRASGSGAGGGKEKVELLIGGQDGEKMEAVDEGKEYGNVN